MDVDNIEADKYTVETDTSLEENTERLKKGGDDKLTETQVTKKRR